MNKTEETIFEVLGALGILAAGAGVLYYFSRLTGRVLDPLSQPVADAAIVVFGLNGEELARTTTDAEGRFRAHMASQILGTIDCIVVVVNAGGVEQHHYIDAPVPRDLPDFNMRPPIVLQGSVGDGGNNRPIDVRRVQERLQYYGRLTAADVQAEPIDITRTNPIPTANIPRLIAALYGHLRTGFGRRLGSLRPNDPTLAFFNSDPLFPPTQIALNGPVGELPGGNVPPANIRLDDTRRVQDRLAQLGVLKMADRQAEIAIPPGNVAVAAVPLTVSAIKAFDLVAAGGSLHAVTPGGPTLAALNDPCLYGRPPLVLQDSVGTGGVNRPADVRKVQLRLREMNLLTPADLAAELVPPVDPHAPPPDPVPEANLARTRTAILALRALIEPAPVALIETVDPALGRLNQPPRISLRSDVGSGSAANLPSDVRLLQERLNLLRLLADPDFAAEKVNPARVARTDPVSIPRTLAAQQVLTQALAQGSMPSLSGEVGAGRPNLPADVRAVQDRLHVLAFLADADYQQERVDPHAAQPPADAALVHTFAAISALRQRVLSLPAAGADPWSAVALVAPGDTTDRLLHDPLRQGRIPLEIRGSVGEGGWNWAPDVKAVQDRLHELKLLSDANYATESAQAVGFLRVAEADLTATVAAIKVLREAFLAEAAPAAARIEPLHPSLRALINPLLVAGSPACSGLQKTLDLSAAVGPAQLNARDDVAAVQDRLHAMRVLSEQDFVTESQRLPAGRVADNLIPATLAAIGVWRGPILGEAAPNRTFVPLDAGIRTLGWPLLPFQAVINLPHSVGRRTGPPAPPNPADNVRAEVRLVQDRLHILGFLSTSDYLAERASANDPVPDVDIPQTLQAISRFQGAVAGGTDGRVDPRGITRRALQDPTYATPTLLNPHSDDTQSGPAIPGWPFPAALDRIIFAIKRVESQRSTGEVPARLRNGSQTPASFGEIQLIGGTAVTTLAGHAALQAFYDLGAAVVPLTQRANAMDAAVIAMFNLVPALAAPPAPVPAMNLAAVVAQFTANQRNFRRDTGLGPEDVVLLARTAFFRRHIFYFHQLLAPPPAGGGPPPNLGAILNQMLAHPIAGPNIVALHLESEDVRTYLRDTANLGENRAGFITRSLFYSQFSQLIRNMMTDHGGLQVGRMNVQDEFNAINAVPAAAGLAPQQIADCVAARHNHGTAAAILVANPPTPATDPGYVGVFEPIWLANPAPPPL